MYGLYNKVFTYQANYLQKTVKPTWCKKDRYYVFFPHNKYL